MKWFKKKEKGPLKIHDAWTGEVNRGGIFSGSRFHTGEKITQITFVRDGNVWTKVIAGHWNIDELEELFGATYDG